MRALLLTDQLAETPDLHAVLSATGCLVDDAYDVDDAVDLGRRYDFDLIVLDHARGNGAALKAIRGAKVAAPVAWVHRDDTVASKCRALNAGADDYLTKPWHAEEAEARFRALVRRGHHHPANVIEVGDLAVNLDSKSVTVAGRPVHLTGSEYAMLELMALRKGVTISKEAFLDHLYGGMDEPGLKIMDVFICKVRRKLRGAAGAHIETVWGRGYRLVTELADPARHRGEAPGPLVALILSRLAKGGECSTARLAAAIARAPGAIRITMTRATERGLVTRRGSGGRDAPFIYAVSAGGRDWLERNAPHLTGDGA